MLPHALGPVTEIPHSCPRLGLAQLGFKPPRLLDLLALGGMHDVKRLRDMLALQETSGLSFRPNNHVANASSHPWKVVLCLCRDPVHVRLSRAQDSQSRPNGLVMQPAHEVIALFQTLPNSTSKSSTTSVSTLKSPLHSIGVLSRIH